MPMLSIALWAAVRKTYLNLFSSKMRGVPQSNRTRSFLSSLGRRRDSEAIARTYIAQHCVDVVALEGVAQFLDLFGGTAGLVNELNFDLQAAEADLVVWLG